MTLEDIGKECAIGKIQKVNLIVKCDIEGSAECLSDLLVRLSTDEIQINILRVAVGEISENDVNLAASTDATIIGFQVRPSENANSLAKQKKVQICLYSTIFEAVDNVRDTIDGNFVPEDRESISGRCEVIDVSNLPDGNTGAHVLVREGVLHLRNKVRVIRGGIVRHTGNIVLLRQNDHNIRRVPSGDRCVLAIAGYNDIFRDDIIECFYRIEVCRVLSTYTDLLEESQDVTSELNNDGVDDTDSFASTCGFNPASDYVVWDDSLWDDLKVTGSSYSPSRVTVPRRSEICSCVYAPAEVRYNKSFIVRVYMYLPQERDAVDSKVKEIDPSAVKKEYKPLDLPVKEGDKLTVQLDLSDGVQCKSTTKSVIWRNHFTDCSFTAKLVDASQDSIEGIAYVFVNDVPAGEMLFTIDVVESQPRELYTNVESHRFSKIFISYAHQDEIQVRGIAEGCRMLGKDYFFDRHTLQARDLFKEKILSYIDRADLFVLCWSKNAAESDWVRIEREHALQLIREGKNTLSIYPLSLRPEAPLPIDMSDKYNFGKL